MNCNEQQTCRYMSVGYCDCFESIYIVSQSQKCLSQKHYNEPVNLTKYLVVMCGSKHLTCQPCKMRMTNKPQEKGRLKAERKKKGLKVDLHHNSPPASHCPKPGPTRWTVRAFVQKLNEK